MLDCIKFGEVSIRFGEVLPLYCWADTDALAEVCFGSDQLLHQVKSSSVIHHSRFLWMSGPFTVPHVACVL